MRHGDGLCPASAINVQLSLNNEGRCSRAADPLLTPCTASPSTRRNVRCPARSLSLSVRNQEL
jgi:hypothetical protein